MRRFVAVLAVALTACSSSSPGTSPSATTLRQPALDEFVRAIAPAGSVAFRARYRVTRKLGPVETDVDVTATPPSWEIGAGDVVVRGPNATTEDEARLSATGVFSTFFADGPRNALVADAARTTAGPALFSTRVVAGLQLRCAGIPQRGVVATTVCITAQGVVGFFDNAAVHYELTAMS